MVTEVGRKITANTIPKNKYVKAFKYLIFNVFQVNIRLRYIIFDELATYHF